MSANRLRYASPGPDDGRVLHGLAEAAGGLDVNSAYSYHLWCREFAASSVLAWSGDRAVGFVTGFRRPVAPDRLFVWQVAVDPECRGAGVGVAMLEHLATRTRPRYVEATVTPSNSASRRMFGRFATERGVAVAEHPYLFAEQLPDGHEPEILLEIGPLAGAPNAPPGPGPLTDPEPSPAKRAGEDE